MPFDQSNKKGKGNQGDIYKTPEEAQSRLSTLQRKQVINVNGQRITISQTGYEFDRNGQPIEINEVQTVIAADGRILQPTDFGGMSWTGLAVPTDRFAECLNPFGHHDHRPVYLGIDGLVTELGNVLCNECADFNYERMRKALKIYLRWFVNPTIY
jgi:hypothetical protein